MRKALIRPALEPVYGMVRTNSHKRGRREGSADRARRKSTALAKAPASSGEMFLVSLKSGRFCGKVAISEDKGTRVHLEILNGICIWLRCKQTRLTIFSIVLTSQKRTESREAFGERPRI